VRLFTWDTGEKNCPILASSVVFYQGNVQSALAFF
jgi:hypothetical protein